MRKLKKASIVALTLITLISCGSGGQPVNAEDFKALGEELKDKFGNDAYYTDFSVSYDESVGVILSVTVTEDPESLQMGEWGMSRGFWEQSSEVTLEIPEGSKASDFMFQLNDKINLEKLGSLVEKSMKQLTSDKNIESPAFEMAYIIFPDNGDVSKANYVVMLEPETGGTSFSYYYKLDGEFINMDY